MTQKTIIEFIESILGGNKALISMERLYTLYVLAKFASRLEGNAIEVGVYNGGSALVLGNVFKSKTLYLCDTFSGMPHCNKEVNDKYTTDAFKESNISVVEALFKGKNVKICQGIFPTDPACDFVKDEKFCFVHLDVDAYQSYKESLEAVYDRVVPGGIIVFDDYGFDAAKLAIENFFMDKPENVQYANFTNHKEGTDKFIMKGEDECSA